MKLIDRYDLPQDYVFYHGSSTIDEDCCYLECPKKTGIIQEKGRLKNLDKVFFTMDKGTANIYAGRSYNSNGGVKRLFRVIPIGNIYKINDLTYCADSAYIEVID